MIARKAAPARKAARKTTTRRAPARRGKTAKAKKTAPPPVRPAVEAPELEPEHGQKMTPRQRQLFPTGRCQVQALCGCVGEFKPELSHLDGPYPYVHVVVRVPCNGHPEQVVSGVVCRFPALIGPRTRQLPAIRPLPAPAVPAQVAA